MHFCAKFSPFVRCIQSVESCVQRRDDSDLPFTGVSEYKIQCERSAQEVQPYPPCAHTSWGPGDSADEYSLTPLHGDAAVLETADDGIVEVLYLRPQFYVHHLSVHFYLRQVNGMTHGGDTFFLQMCMCHGLSICQFGC